MFSYLAAMGSSMLIYPFVRDSNDPLITIIFELSPSLMILGTSIVNNAEAIVDQVCYFSIPMVENLLTPNGVHTDLITINDDL
jgi:hypothetical protein